MAARKAQERPKDLTTAAMAADRGRQSLLDAKGQLPRDLVIEWWPITRLKPYPNNPRDNKLGIPDVKQSLMDFGWQQPIVVDKDGVIVVGHTRYYAALDLLQTHVPVYHAKRLTPAQAKAYRLADNKIHERTEWVFPKLATEFQQFKAMGVTDLRFTGFRDFEIRPIIESEWTPPPATGTLGGEARKDGNPAVVTFSDAQLPVVLAAVERYRQETEQPQMSVADALAGICAAWTP